MPEKLQTYRPDILHSHYKDSYDRIREREKQRDCLFLLVVALLGLIALELRYSVAIHAAISELSLGGLKVKLSQVPLPVLLSTTWTFFSVMLLRYYQVTIDVEKKYTYLLVVEARLSKCIGEKKIICRESSAYITKKGKWFRYWAWLFYTAAFPVIILVIVVCTILIEVNNPDIPSGHIVYDCVIAGLSLVSVLLYLFGVWFKK